MSKKKVKLKPIEPMAPDTMAEFRKRMFDHGRNGFIKLARKHLNEFGDGMHPLEIKYVRKALIAIEKSLKYQS